MFRWYQDSTKCYVYLSDVSTGEHSQLSKSPWEPAFYQVDGLLEDGRSKNFLLLHQ